MIAPGSQPAPNARAQARQAVVRDPRDAMAWIVLSEAELDAGSARTGAEAARRALELAPGHPEALARLGRAQWMLGQHAAAVQSLRAAERSAPDHPGIAVWLGHALEDAGEAEAASDAYARAHRLLPGEPQIAGYLLAWRRRLCDWQEIDALARQVGDAVRRGQPAIEPFAFLSEDSTPAEQLQCARVRANSLAAIRPIVPAEVTPPADERVHVGFISNGFGAHPTGLLTVALLEALAGHERLQLHLFATTPGDGSAVRRRLESAGHAFHDVSHRAHADIARTIRTARIDVLFDLRGWGGGGVPEVLAMRPAPVQVNWLAYPGTSGAPWIDYVLADAFVLPDALAAHFSEAVIRLPRCFQPSDTTRAVAVAADRGTFGLPAYCKGVVFCCFNNSYKLNPRSVSRAMKVLAGVPTSVLWLLSGPGDADQRLTRAAHAAGIDAARLVFMPKQPQAEYLSRLQCADLFLDTSPYNAHTTASDSLWAGCPVLTCPGDTFASRVAGSLNHHLGLDDMNCDDDDAFVAIAIALGRDASRLDSVRDRLHAARSTSGLFDMDAMARDFARAVLAMHRSGPVTRARAPVR